MRGSAGSLPFTEAHCAPARPPHPQPHPQQPCQPESTQPEPGQRNLELTLLRMTCRCDLSMRPRHRSRTTQMASSTLKTKDKGGPGVFHPNPAPHEAHQLPSAQIHTLPPSISLQSPPNPYECLGVHQAQCSPCPSPFPLIRTSFQDPFAREGLKHREGK